MLPKIKSTFKVLIFTRVEIVEKKVHQATITILKNVFEEWQHHWNTDGSPTGFEGANDHLDLCFSSWVRDST